MLHVVLGIAVWSDGGTEAGKASGLMDGQEGHPAVTGTRLMSVNKNQEARKQDSNGMLKGLWGL